MANLEEWKDHFTKLIDSDPVLKAECDKNLAAKAYAKGVNELMDNWEGFTDIPNKMSKLAWLTSILEMDDVPLGLVERMMPDYISERHHEVVQQYIDAQY